MKQKDLSDKLDDARLTLQSILDDMTDDLLTVKGEQMVEYIEQTLRRTRPCL
jgi:hypothetical protein